MLLYNWTKIFETCKGNASEMVVVLKMMVEKQIPNNRFDRIYKYSNTDFRGESFLLHPDVLLYKFLTDPKNNKKLRSLLCVIQKIISLRKRMENF